MTGKPLAEQPDAASPLTLTVQSVPDYIASRPALAGLVDPASLEVDEVGDGNLNQVFICRGTDGRNLVLKQSLPYVRLVGPSWPMSEERAAKEAATIRAHSAVSDHVCALIDYDPERHVLALEDLSDHAVLRTHLNNGGDNTGVAEALGEFLADVVFGTSFLTLGEEPFRLAAAEAVNTELCALTEDVIFTEPFLGADRNSVQPSVQSVVDQLQADPEWVAAAMQLKLRFLTVGEALLHGDLHTGSVFVRREDEDIAAQVPGGVSLSVKTFDSEFSFYGPIGFDMGLLWANLLIAGVRAAVLGERDRSRALFAGLQASWTAFTDRLRAHWPDRQSAEKYTDAFLDHWLESIRVDAFGFAGCEAARRIIGLAKVSDIESLTGEQHRVAATAVLGLSKLLLVDRATLDFDTVTAAAERLAALTPPTADR